MNKIIAYFLWFAVLFMSSIVISLTPSDFSYVVGFISGLFTLTFLLESNEDNDI